MVLLPLYILLGLLLMILFGILVAGIVKFYKEQTKYNYKSMIFVEYKQTQEGKHVYKFVNVDDEAIAMHGSPRLKDSLQAYCMYHLETEKDKYIIDVKKIA
ncbi:hypothetical protein LC76P1_00007 [Lysinibacillus phage LC76P1]|nr:hypothetical protein LC76P1_00007 [Lysinibacillus phage LC76P1]